MGSFSWFEGQASKPLPSTPTKFLTSQTPTPEKHPEYVTGHAYGWDTLPQLLAAQAVAGLERDFGRGLNPY